jgi:hypothetical protein
MLEHAGFPSGILDLPLIGSVDVLAEEVVCVPPLNAG